MISIKKDQNSQINADWLHVFHVCIDMQGESGSQSSRCADNFAELSALSDVEGMYLFLQIDYHSKLIDW